MYDIYYLTNDNKQASPAASVERDDDIVVVSVTLKNRNKTPAERSRLLFNLTQLIKIALLDNNISKNIGTKSTARYTTDGSGNLSKELVSSMSIKIVKSLTEYFIIGGEEHIKVTLHIEVKDVPVEELDDKVNGLRYTNAPLYAQIEEVLVELMYRDKRDFFPDHT